MLSNPPPSGLPARHHRQHRRQNSTPTAMEAVKIASNLPSYPHPQQASSAQPQPQPPQPQQARAGRPRVAHRRGMSLDTRRQHMHSPLARQDFLTVSENTNTAGYNSAPQHVLREAQQQCLARPGSHQQAFANLANDENYIMSPHGTPHTQGFAPNTCFDGLQGPAPALNMSYNLYNEQMNAMVKKNQDNFSGNMAAGSQDFDLYPSSTMSTPTFIHFNESPSAGPGWISEEETSSSRRSSRRVSNTIMDRVAKFENMGLEDPPRPITPPHQNATDYFPITPMDSPGHGRTTIKSSRGPQRFMEGYDESMEETLKPTRGTRRPKTTFDEMREAAETQSPAPVPGPSRSHTMPVTSSFEAPPVANTNFLEMGQMSGGMAVPTFDGLPEPPYPLSASSSFSHHSTPITPLMHEFRQASEQKSYLLPPETAIDSVSGEESESGERPPRGHSHRRTESVASVASAASIADIDIEQTKTTTGITMDDIHQYIDGPDPQDNKWVCTFEDCLKRFGRKENIKSHVQTHLNDRQYQCPTCQKCFVRQHDLKRHAKIHTGIKPYPCECGNSFARHDALTRHKQRGMCIGAFDGVVRKVVKRGRPRKHRPELDERQEKSTRTRKKNMSISSVSSVSSQSGYSDCSAPSSPGADDNDNDDTEFELLGDIMHDVSMGGTTMNPSNLQPGLGASTAPMPTLSPNAALGTHERSPSVASVHSYVSQLSHMSLHPGAPAEALPSNPASPAKSIGSQYNEPPELSQSSSPPASCNRYFELEPSVTGPDIMISAAVDSASLPPMGGMANAGEDDVLLQFTHNDPNMLMLSSDSKFDEAFDSSVDMFTHSDDLFFGHNQ